MKATVTQAFNAYDNSKYSVNFVVIGKVHPATQHSLLQKVIQVVAFAQKETHVQRIVKPS
jgi:putative lipoic acid-binding regulatory protein